MNPTPPSEHTPKKSSPRRWPLWLASGVLTLILVLAGLIFAALKTEPGTRLLWQTVSGLLPGTLSGDLIGGTVSDGLTLRNVVYRDATKLVKIDRLESAWSVSRSPLQLSVRYLRIGSADVTLFPSTEPPTPAALPREFTLPLGVELHELSVRQLVVRKDVLTFPFSAIRLKARSDRVQHTLELETLDTPYGAAQAYLRLNGRHPFALSGTAALKGMYKQQNYRLATRLSGTLETIGVQLDAAGDKLGGRAKIEATPFSPIPFRRAEIDIGQLDPNAFNPAWPKAELDIRAELTPRGARNGDLAQLVVSGPVSISNARAGALDQGLLPLVSAAAEVRMDRQTQRLTQMLVRLSGDAALSGGGEIRGKAGRLALDAKNLDLHALHTALKPTALNGPLHWRMTGDTQFAELELTDPAFAVAAKAELGLKQIVLRSATLKSGPARLAVSGTLARDAQAGYTLKGKLTEFDPGRFLATVQDINARGAGKAGKPAPKRSARGKPIDARINTDFAAQGVLRPELSAKIRFDVYDSHYDKLPMTGRGTIQFAGTRILPSDANLFIAGNRLALKGSFGAAGDRLRVDIDAPALHRLGFGLSGLLRLNGWVGGTLTRPIVDATYRAERLALGDLRVASLTGAARSNGVPGRTPNAQLTLDLHARGVQVGIADLSRLDADIDGSYARHTIRIGSSGRLRGRPLEVELAARGRLQETAQGLAWDGVVSTLENRSQPRVSLNAPLAVSAAPGRIELGSARLGVAQATIDLRRFSYRAGQIRSEGEMSAVDVGHLLALWQQFSGNPPPVDTDLVLDGRWNVAWADSATGFVHIARRRGDVRLLRDTALGLSDLNLRADFLGNRVRLDAQAGATRIGRVSGQGYIGLQRADGRLTVTPQAPVSGRVQASIPDLRSISTLAGPSIVLKGKVEIDLSASGRLGDPKLSGSVAGDRLELTLYDLGVRLHDGSARIRLDNNVVELRELVFRGGDGTLRATGRVPLDRASRELTASITADKLQLLASPGGQLTLSGQARAANVNERLLISGKFIVDQARFNLPEKTAPKLGDDVVVIRGGKPTVAERQRPIARKPASPFTPAIDLEVGLGERFYFQGSGADLRLGGTLNVRSEPGQPPQLFGTVRVVEGTYEAFGAELAIERGIINFQGPLDNPNVNILAMRRDQEVAAGVQVSGTVQRPRVQLVSEPALSEEEKLSWLIFGRGGGDTDRGQTQAALTGAATSAAFGLLNKFGGERVAKTFGLDELSIGESEVGTESGQVVNLGKEISDRLYVGYEQSLAGAGSMVKLTYELTQYWSVVARGGTVTGFEMLYHKRFDSIK